MIRICQMKKTLANILDGLRNGDEMCFIKTETSKGGKVILNGKIIRILDIRCGNMQSFIDNDVYLLIKIVENGIDDFDMYHREKNKPYNEEK